MEVKVTREFQGYINSVEFNDQNIFYTTRETLEEIIENFGEVFTDEFISDLAQAIKRCVYKTDEFSFSTFEEELRINVTTADSFEEIVFTPIYFDNYVNNEIKRGTYSK